MIRFIFMFIYAVDFVRKNYGFSDEDYVELKRIRDLITIQKKEIKMSVQLSDGRLLNTQVLGSRSYDEVIQELEDTYNTPIIDIIFDDDSNMDIPSVNSENNINNNSSSSSSVSNNLIIDFNHPIDSIPLWQRSNWDIDMKPPSISTNNYLDKKKSSSYELAPSPSILPMTYDVSKWRMIHKLISPSVESPMIGIEHFVNIIPYKLYNLQKYLNMKGYKLCQFPVSIV